MISFIDPSVEQPTDQAEICGSQALPLGSQDCSTSSPSPASEAKSSNQVFDYGIHVYCLGTVHSEFPVFMCGGIMRAVWDLLSVLVMFSHLTSLGVHRYHMHPLQILHVSGDAPQSGEEKHDSRTSISSSLFGVESKEVSASNSW